MNMKIDFNCDMGESFGVYKLGCDEEVIKYITSANIACGFHAGDPMWMQRTVQLAEEFDVGVGAQPSFPDLVGFGRRNVSVSPEEARNDVIYQIGALQAFTRGKKLQHVKPHGAMYNMAVKDEALARAICQAALDVDPEMILVVLAGTPWVEIAAEMIHPPRRWGCGWPERPSPIGPLPPPAICQAALDVDPEMILVVLAGTPWVEIAAEMGLRVAREAFADRAFTASGTLVPRAVPGAVIHDLDQVVERSIKMVAQGKVAAITGEVIEMHADSLCLHGDTPGAVEMAWAVKEGLLKAGAEIVPMSRLV